MLIVDPYYEPFLAAAYKGIDLRGQPYEAHWNHLMAWRFGTSDFYSRGLAPCGIQAHEIVPNADAMQLAWTREHAPDLAQLGFLSRIPRLRRVWQHAVVRRQVAWFKPDAMLHQNAGWTGRDLPGWARDRGVFQVLQHATVVPPVSSLRRYDLIVSSIPLLVEQFEKWGFHARFLRLGFGRIVAETSQPQRPHYDVVHVGSYGGLHHERDAFLERVSERTGCLFWGHGIEALPSTSEIRRNFRGEAWGVDMYGVRRASRFTLTKHVSSVAGPWANNCTMYETTGVGSCLVVDAKKNLPQLFTPDEEVVAYSSPEEAAEKIQYLLDHEEQRQDIARKGRERTLSEHTYEHRMSELADILNSAL